MNLPLAAAGATALALIELSVLPYIKIADLKPDLVLVVVVVVAAVFGLERAIGWAFVGGLLLDLLSAGPYRPLGATAFTLLVVAGLTAAAIRFIPGGRAAVTIALGFALAIVYHVLVLFFLSLRGVTAEDPLTAIVPIAVLDAALAVPLVAAAVLLERRTQRQEGLGW